MAFNTNWSLCHYILYLLYIAKITKNVIFVKSHASATLYTSDKYLKMSYYNQKRSELSSGILLLLIVLIPLFTACNDKDDSLTYSKLELFSFLPDHNPGLDEAFVGKISGNEIKISVPHNYSLNSLVATFKHDGIKVEVGNIEQISNITENNFSQTVIYSVISSSGKTTEYSITVTNAAPRLPRLHINTSGGFEFQDNDKEKYVSSTVRLEDLDQYFNGELSFTAEGEIKGRGNSTWWGVPKKPYRIRLDKKQSLLGMSNDRNWALLANYYDKTLLRNITAFEISRIAEMSWTPQSVSVDFYMNGSYRGVYSLTEHVRVSDERLDMELVSSDDNSGEALTGGYFLELDFHFDEPYKFKTNMRKLPIMFKDPDEPTQAQFDYVKDYFNTAEAILYSENYTDPEEGYRKYIDVKSFVNYYIVQELAKNVDGNLRGSCYMAIRRNGKIELPLVWDFDIAFGNADHITWEQGASSKEWDGWFIKTQSPWFDRLFQDPYFVESLKTRWNELMPQLKEVPDFIRDKAEILEVSQARNFTPKPYGAGWDIMKPEWNTSTIRGSYENEVTYLIHFVEKRLDWLDIRINNL